MELDNVTSNLRDFYTKAYLGISPGKAPKYWILFQVSLPPLGWNTYFVSTASGKGTMGVVLVILMFHIHIVVYCCWHFNKPSFDNELFIGSFDWREWKERKMVKSHRS